MFVDEGIGEEDRKNFHSGSFEGRALGDDRFIDQVLIKAQEKRPTEITLEQVIEGVCSIYRLTPAELCAAGKAQPAAEARAVAAHLVRNVDSLSLTCLAHFLNRELSGLSQAALRVERRAATDDGLRRKLDLVFEKLKISICQV